MSDAKKSEGSPVNGLAIVAGIVCAIAGYSKAEWSGALVAGLMGFGGVHLVFKFIGVLWTWLAVSAVLLLILAVLVNRWHALAPFFH